MFDVLAYGQTVNTVQLRRTVLTVWHWRVWYWQFGRGTALANTPNTIRQTWGQT